MCGENPTRGSGRSREPEERKTVSGDTRIEKSLMDRTNLDGVLVLTGEGVDGSLLDTLLALRQALVPKRRDRLAQSFDVDIQT